MGENLSSLFSDPPPDLARSMGAKKRGEMFTFRGFGQECCVDHEKVTLSGIVSVDPKGLLVSLYARHANPDEI